jgi:hypothetical protein
MEREAVFPSSLFMADPEQGVRRKTKDSSIQMFTMSFFSTSEVPGVAGIATSLAIIPLQRY